jgi:hypothetical protein
LSHLVIHENGKKINILRARQLNAPALTHPRIGGITPPEEVEMFKRLLCWAEAVVRNTLWAFLIATFLLYIPLGILFGLSMMWVNAVFGKVYVLRIAEYAGWPAYMVIVELVFIELMAESAGFNGVIERMRRSAKRR